MKRSAIKGVGIFFKKVSIIFLFAILATALLTGVFFLPVSNKVKVNAYNSAEVFNKEGNYKNLFSWCSSRLDNWTDAIIILEATDDTKDTALRRAMMAYRGGFETYDDNTPVPTISRHYLEKKDFECTYSYERYWHGFLLFIKPLLLFMDYSYIRLLNSIIQIICITLLITKLYKKKMKEYIIPFLLAYFMLMPVVLFNSIQLSTCFYVMITGVLGVLNTKNGKNNKILIGDLFLVLGILTSFFDFLTYPLATFGIPFVVYLVINNEKKLGIKILDFFKTGINWGSGYFGMWACKWMIGSIITGKNIFTNAMDAIVRRTATTDFTGEVSYSIIEAIESNYKAFFNTPITFFVLLFVLWKLYKICKSFYLKKCKVDLFTIMIPYVILSLLPVLWYLVTVNHSTIHFWFTNKLCVITVLSFMGMLVEIQRKIDLCNNELYLQ